MLFISKLDGKLSCSEHDPCGPEPLEPGEIREYVPNMTSVRPRNIPLPVSVAPQSKSSSPVPMSSLPAKHRPPPRLYINTKTATSSFVPFNRPYLTDNDDGKPVSSSSSSEDREDGEVEDGEVCQLEVEDNDEEDEEEEDNETGEMEIVEDEEDELLYGGNLLVDDNKETEDGHVYDGWSDYVDEDEDGEVQEEEEDDEDDDDDWRMVVDEDK